MSELFLYKYFEDHRIYSQKAEAGIPCRYLRWERNEGCPEFCSGWIVSGGEGTDVGVHYRFNRTIEDDMFVEAWHAPSGACRAGTSASTRNGTVRASTVTTIPTWPG